MEHVNNIISAVVEPEPVSFDAVEIAGLIIPVLFAILTIVLVTLNPDPSGTAAKASEAQSQKLEQIHRR